MAEKPLLTAPRDYHVEFDRENGYKYSCCMASAAATLGTAGLALLCLPCFPWRQRKEINAQKCTITDERVVLESGWINRSTRNIPLDRIQDINVTENLVQRCFGVTGVEIQTAGGGNGPHSEAYLIVPLDASMVRDTIMSRRD
jgi:membrane protein YdbS with pleckstrin-like domain|uniref:YdbS-like PH domain-containing protein n=1 Tax=Globisporangium ultimum (strain ATCC 200006 / CBS 805.95 / DAOM BR144) TaxID=431595 RepID=K3WRN3_GLOUD